jgi:tetratricopeptide (TPR) repeat protein
MLTFLGAAILFAIGYGTYVYLQISNPAFLRSTPPPGPLQAAAPLPPPVAPQASAKISGLPVVDQANNATPLPSTTPQSPAINLGAAATQPGVRERTRPTPKPRLQPAALSPEPVRSEDEEGLETIELPASPQVAALGTAESPATAPSDRQDIAVRRQKGTAQEIDPTLASAYHALVAGDYGRSRALYQEVLQADARSIDALLGLAAIAWKEGRSEEASSLYGQILEIDPRNAHAQAGLIALVGGADPAAAELRLKQLIAREPSGFLYFTLGNLYAGQRQWPAAQQAYFQAYQFAPDNPDYAFNLAVGLEHLGQPNLALDYYRKALDLSFKKGRANFDQNLAIQRVGQLSARTN